MNRAVFVIGFVFIVMMTSPLVSTSIGATDQPEIPSISEPINQEFGTSFTENQVIGGFLLIFILVWGSGQVTTIEKIGD